MRTITVYPLRSPGTATAAFLLGLTALALAAQPPAPENLARRAKATATSEFSGAYLARFACDGRIPSPISQADVGQAWAAEGNDHPNGVLFTLEWPQPVTVAEIVYYGRTGWVWGENWKDYEVYLDPAGPGPHKATAKGSLQPGHGPQRIKLAKPVQVTRLALKFLTSHGGPNPGASEIQVYAQSPPEAALGKFTKPSSMDATAPPPPEIKESAELAARLKAGALGFSKLVLVQRHHVNSSHVYTYHCEGQRNGGGLFIADVTDGTDGKGLTKIVDATDGQILGCDLSHDARTVLFSLRKKGSPYYQVYTINVDGTGLKQLTSGECYNYDAAWLPDGRIVFLSSRIPQAAYCFFTPVGILYTMNADGSDQRRISSNYLNDFTPAVTNDGRIIYGRWEYVDRPAIPIQSLWTINPDGTMLQGFFGNRVLDPASFIEPQAIPGSPAILCTMTGHNGSCRGAIGIVHPIHGDNAQASIRNITPEIRLRGVTVSSNGPQGPYQTPYPVDSRYFLVSYDGTILLRDYDATEQTIVLAPRNLGFYNPRPLRPRPAPPVRPSTLPDGPQEPWATVYIQDIYNGLEPHVRRGEVVQIAIVQELRRTLIDSPGIQRPAFDFQRVLVSCGATYVPKKLWGYVRVAADGSAYFRVPARVPIYFIALDAQGRAVQRMRSFTHLMPGETQGCIGCHEQRSTGPRHALAVSSVSGTPQDITPPEWGARGFDYASIVQPVLDQHCTKCHNPLAAEQAARPQSGAGVPPADGAGVPPASLTLAGKMPAPRGGAGVPPAGRPEAHPIGRQDACPTLDLTGDRTDYFNMSYEVLARHKQGRTGSPYVSWIPVYNGHEWNIQEITPKKWGSPVSKLADLILTGHPDADGKPRIALDDAARRRVFAWIDLNVPYYGTADTAHPELPACRQALPPDLRKVMDDVYARRCAECHGGAGILPAAGGAGILPADLQAGRLHHIATPWRGHAWAEIGIRIENPQLNAFLLAPLARAAGGTERCGRPVFASRGDPDLQAVLRTFEPIHRLLRERPRMDMPGATPAAACPVVPEGM